MAKDKNNNSDNSENLGFRVFAAIGRFSIKFRWLIVLLWVIGAFAAAKYLPTLSSAVQSNNSNFLPAAL